MKNFKSIKHFVVLAAGACILAVVAALLAYNYFATARTEEAVENRTSSLLKSGIDERLSSLSEAKASEINRKLEQALGIAKDLASASELVATPESDGAHRIGRPELSALVKKAVSDNPFLLDAFIGWEPNAFGPDSAYSVPSDNTESYDGSGRFRPWSYRNDQGVVEVLSLNEEGMSSEKMLDSGIRRGEYYLCSKESGETCIVDPAFYDYGGKQVMVATFSVPIIVDGTFRGIAGTDLSVDFIQGLLTQANGELYDGAGRMALVAPVGRLVAYTGDASMLGKPAVDILQGSSIERLKQVQQGGNTVQVMDQDSGMVEIYKPVKIGETGVTWALVIHLPISAVMADLATLQQELHDQRVTDILGMLAISAVVTVLGLMLIWWVGRNIARPLGHLADRMQDIASGDGDLTQRLPVSGRNELAAVAAQFNAFVEKINGVMLDVRDSSENVKLASGEISTGSLDLSRRTENTAASLEESAAAMEELTSTVANSAESSRHASTISSSAAKSAEEGGEAMVEVTATMREISNSAKEIESIIGVIDSIAFQTNLLALNASVEAARAGEQGRGFAVVAEEVRSLANRSTKAAKEIKTLIDASVDKTASGEALVQRAGERITGIVDQVRRVNDLIGEISTAAEEQNTGIFQVNQAVSQLDQMTQENAALVEESAAASDALSQEARRLADIIGVFRLRERGEHEYVATGHYVTESDEAPSAHAREREYID
ncbi:methyl-accepting chemotaxis protein [Larsenimonas suaedae]|uniref:Methyl-accepting chemotaxis protein n=1 Tax=Larsenimonas suaedae TaxID=1851019 RepID=A0ABU1GRR8_9GAMM|nr:methyl-accepting chemotaxis protein [Larsenimonas suaedae]MCM2972499.1 methyl-accepting chemotaxis protein [Larsenimonas suaedae]MDR5894705.1 methyl-accepting chemotaxis protein [Larsenimonas suaedae]